MIPRYFKNPPGTTDSYYNITDCIPYAVLYVTWLLCNYPLILLTPFTFFSQPTPHPLWQPSDCTVSVNLFHFCSRWDTARVVAVVEGEQNWTGAERKESWITGMNPQLMTAPRGWHTGLLLGCWSCGWLLFCWLRMNDLPGLWGQTEWLWKLFLGLLFPWASLQQPHQRVKLSAVSCSLKDILFT